MDQIKIGKFIAEARKEQNLTQLDLAEKLGISNKTISKWECGNGMPDYAVMESLCETLSININELLSGERLPSQEYSKKAEENMISLIQERSENNKRDIREWFKFMIGIVVLAFFVWLTIIMWGGAPAVAYFIDFPSILYVLINIISAFFPGSNVPISSSNPNTLAPSIVAIFNISYAFIDVGSIVFTF